MRGQHDLRAFLDRIFDRRKRAADPGIVFDGTAFYRNVKIDPNKNGLAGDIHIFDRLFLHYLLNGSARS